MFIIVRFSNTQSGQYSTTIEGKRSETLRADEARFLPGSGSVHRFFRLKRRERERENERARNETDSQRSLRCTVARHNATAKSFLSLVLLFFFFFLFFFISFSVFGFGGSRTKAERAPQRAMTRPRRGQCGIIVHALLSTLIDRFHSTGEINEAKASVRRGSANAVRREKATALVTPELDAVE